MNKSKSQADSLLSSYRTAFANSRQGFCLLEKVAIPATKSPDFRFLLTNLAFQQQVNLHQPDGKTIRQLMPQVETLMLDRYDRVALTGQSTQFESYVSALDQWMAIDAFRVGEFGPPWIGVLFNNVTGRKQREADLAFLAEVSQDLARLTDIDQTMNALGEKIGRYLGLSACVFGEIFGQNEAQITEINHGWNRADTPSLLGTYQMSEFMTLEMIHMCRSSESIVIRDVFADPKTDGAQFAAINVGSFVGIPFVRDGEWRFLLVIYRSQPYEWSEEEIEMTRELMTRIWTRLERARAEEALHQEYRRKDEFMAMLGHELRNPLASVANTMLVLQLTQGQDESLTYPRAVEQMSREIGHMTRLVDDLLDVGRIRYGLIQLQLKPVDLVRIVRQTVETASPLYQERGRQLSVSLPSYSLAVLGDETRLAQVLMNLLTNGLKYTHPGGHVWVSVELVDNTMASPQVLLRVKDDGIGIAADQQTAIFEIFVQGATTLDRPLGGLGIGLALVKQLVTLHKGSIQVRSAGLEQGSEFLIQLPLTQEVLRLEPKAQPKLRSGPAKGKVLVVDDNQTIADMTARLVELIGYEAQASYTGGDALAVAQQWHPNVVILDLGLPDMDGFAVSQRLGEQPWGRGLSIIALTGYGQESLRERARHAGFKAYLLKPINLPQLQEVLTRVLAESPAAPSN